MAPKLVNTIRFKVLIFFLVAGGVVNLVLVLGTFFTTRAGLMDHVKRELTLTAQLGSQSIDTSKVQNWMEKNTPDLTDDQKVLLKTDPSYIDLESRLEKLRTNGMGENSLLYIFKKGTQPNQILYLAFSQSPPETENTNIPFQEESGDEFPTMLKALETGSMQIEQALTWDEVEKVYSLSAFSPLEGTDKGDPIFLGIDYTDKGLNDRIFGASAFIFAAALAMVLVLAFGGIFLSRKLKKSFGTIYTLVEDLAQGEGNLNQRIEIFTKDEFGFLAKHLNHFIGTIHHIVLNVQNIGDTQENLSLEMEKILEDHNRLSSSALGDVNAMAGRYEILSGSVSTTVGSVRDIGNALVTLEDRLTEEQTSLAASATAMEGQVSSLENISHIAMEKEKVSKDLKQVTEKGFLTVREAFRHLEAAAGDLGQIQQAITLIQDISENTNLLAMNAAIEAAHAGEKGKGFAVIAGEIRSLSSRTKTNAQSITLNLENLISNLGAAQRTGKESSGALQTISQEIDNLIQSFLSILDLLTKTNQGNETIKKSMSELKSLSVQVHEASLTINEKAHESQMGMEVIAAVNLEINRQVGVVKEKISTLSEAADHLRGLGENNAETLSELLGEISRFKT